MNKKMITAALLLGSIAIANAISMHNCSTVSNLSIMLSNLAKRQEYFNKHPEAKAALEEAERKYKQTPESVRAQNFIRSSNNGDIAKKREHLSRLEMQCWDDYTSRTFSSFFPQPLVCQEYKGMQEHYATLENEMNEALEDERQTLAYKDYQRLSDRIDYLSKTKRY